MKLIPLTPSNSGARQQGTKYHVSADQIVAIEVPYPGEESIVYTSVKGIYHRVMETPEQIERLANS